MSVLCPSNAADMRFTRAERLQSLGSFLWHEHPLGLAFWTAECGRIAADQPLSPAGAAAVRAMAEPEPMETAA